MAGIKQASFVGGEIAPELHARTDLDRYPRCVRTALNWIVSPQGPLTNRPGFWFWAASKDSTKLSRLIPFIFSADQAYVLEFGEGYIRFHTATGTVLDGAEPFEVVTPYLDEQLPRLKFTQLNDVLTIANGAGALYNLKRYADDDWRLTPASTVRAVNPPTAVALDGGFAWGTVDAAHPEETWQWVVCAVDAGGQRSLPSVPLVVTDAVLYGDRPKPVLTWTAPTSGNAAEYYDVFRGRHGAFGWVGFSRETAFTDEGAVPTYQESPPEGRNPYEVRLAEAGADVYLVETFAGDTATKSVAPEASNGMYTFRWRVRLDPGGSPITVRLQTRPAGGGAWTQQGADLTYIPEGPTSFPPPFDFYNWNDSRTFEIAGLGAGAEFRIEQVSGGAGLTRQQVDWVGSPAPEVVQSVYPAALAFFEQRLVLANWTHNATRFLTSRTGDFTNFDESFFLQDDDPVDLTLAAATLNEIRSVLAFRKALWAFSAGGIWTVKGAEGPLTPSSYALDQVVQGGVSWLDPIMIGKVVLYVGDRSRSVHDIMLDPFADEVVPRDLTILACHLLKDFNLTDWAYQRHPWGIAWAVRDDGALLGLTHEFQHDVWGWHRHTTLGAFESVCAIPEGRETAVYAMVRRTVDGETVRYLERMASRQEPEADGQCFLDSAIEYDGRNAGAVEITATGLAGWGANKAMALEADGAAFEAGDVGKFFRLVGADGARVEFEVTAYVGATEVEARSLEAVPESLQAVGTAEWARGSIDFAGLDHLEGETVTALVDGAVATGLVVAAGAVALPVPGYRVIAGLPYVSDLESLNIHAGDDVRSKPKLIRSVALELSDYRGLWVGEDLAHLTEVQARTVESGGGPQGAETKLVQVEPSNRWRDTARVAVRQTYPLPVTLLSLIPRLVAGSE